MFPKVLKYKGQFLSLFRLLLNKTFSKRGFSWSGKLVSSALLTLTHVYPLENKFVNPDEWNSEGTIISGSSYMYWRFPSAEFRKNHHRYWGKLYKPEDIVVNISSSMREPSSLRIFSRSPGIVPMTRKLILLSRSSRISSSPQWPCWTNY